MVPEKKFVSHYMLTEAEYSNHRYCRWFAEEMRSNKKVQIIEYFEVNGNGFADDKLATVAELKKISHSSIVRVIDFFREGESVFVVTEIPIGEPLKPMEQFDEERFRNIGESLLRALIVLQRKGIGFIDLSMNEIFIDEAGEVHLQHGDGWILKPQSQNHQVELALLGKALLNLFVPIHDSHQEISRTFLQENVPQKVLPLFEEIFIDHTMQYLESASHYFRKKEVLSSDSSLIVEETEQSPSQKITRYLILAGIAVAIFLILSPRTNQLQELSEFDVMRFKILGYLGSTEPQRILGEVYEKGYGVEKDMNQAIEWYRKAAQNGNVYAQMSLGNFYAQGIGLPVNREQALYWFTLAAANGDKLAKQNIEYMQKAQDELQMVSMKTMNISDEVPSQSITTQETETQHVKHELQPSIPIRRYHTYWLHSGSSNNMQNSNQYGGIFGCYEEGLKNPVELVSFSHDVRSMAVDGEGNLYWADITTGQIVKADPNGQNPRAIIAGVSSTMGIAIDKKRKLLFWSDRRRNERGFSGAVGKSDLDGNNAKYIVVDGLASGGKLKVDENEAKLYIPDIVGRKIVRVNEDGQNMIGIVFSVKPEGFDIDTVRRKLYWTDDLNSGIYESDYDGRNKRIVYTYYTTDENFETVMINPATQRIYFGKLGPGSQSIWSVALNSEWSVRPREYITNFKIHDIISN